jgi:hypothetical protein
MLFEITKGFWGIPVARVQGDVCTLGKQHYQL